jgi:hypothetical protein
MGWTNHESRFDIWQGQEISLSFPKHPDWLGGSSSLKSVGTGWGGVGRVGALLGGRNGQGVKLTADVYLVTRLRVRGALSPLPQ